MAGYKTIQTEAITPRRECCVDAGLWREASDSKPDGVSRVPPFRDP